MTTSFSSKVSTKVELEQCRAILNDINAPAMREACDALSAEGLKLPEFKADLGQVIEDGQNAEAKQERLKQRYVQEAGEDQVESEKGYRWQQRLQAKGKFAVAAGVNIPNLRERLRFGKLRRPRARGVIYHLRIVLPELEEMLPALTPFGIDSAFLAEGQQILNNLGAERAETAEVKAEREDMTRQVRAAEKRMDQLLSMIDAADQAAALARPAARRSFTLDIIRAEMARNEAEHLARVAKRPVEAGIDPVIDPE